MQTIGERLEEGRKRKGISIREAAEATKIRGDYLQKFESNQFDIGLTDIYVKGFLRNYAVFLKLPADRILADFAALGHAEARPRQPNREVYGRMEVSVASADDRAERSPAAVAEPAAPEPVRQPSHANRGPHGPRQHATGLPAGPNIDPNLIFKGGLAVAALIVVLGIVWAAKSLVGRGGGTAAESLAATPAAAPAPIESTFKLLALDAVTVRVTSVADNRILFEGPLARGQEKIVPWPGKVWIQANIGANLNFEVSGQRMAMPAKAGSQSASNEAVLPGPTGSP